MPGWHEATKEHQRQGRLQIVGIVQEQHSDRARLFMQWKGMDWPLLVDALDLLEVTYVPITLLIDERGVVREVAPPMSDATEIVQRFLSLESPDPDDDTVAVRRSAADVSRLKAEAVRAGTAEAWRHYAEQLTLWGGEERLDDAIQAFERALAVEPGHAFSHFRLGVSLRARYDSARGRAEDFQRAVEQWGRALDIDPNNYIWRRRIEQYGPRLTKPYPFYDWVNEARETIRARGETPLPLRVEPAGAEFARPLRGFESVAAETAEPDPEGKVYRDKGRLVVVETTVVPQTVERGAAARVHVVFRPNPAHDGHWNNEAGELQLWLSPPEGWQVNRRRLSLPNPPELVSLEPRKLEFELRVPESAAAGPATLPAYAVYYVCEGARGACLYRRQDLPVSLRVR